MDSRSSEAGCVAVMGAAIDVSVRYVSRVDAVNVPMSDCLGDCSSCFGAREESMGAAVCGAAGGQEATSCGSEAFEAPCGGSATGM